MFLTDCNAYSAEAICNRIRLIVADTPITAENGTVFKVTISIGAVVVPQGQVIKADTIFTYADKKLYIAKNSGKNRVEIISADDIQD